MKNLEFVTEKTREKVLAMLADPAVRNVTKEAIRAGLERDCVDAVSDLLLAVTALKLIMDDCLKR